MKYPFQKILTMYCLANTIPHQPIQSHTIKQNDYHPTGKMRRMIKKLLPLQARKNIITIMTTAMMMNMKKKTKK